MQKIKKSNKIQRGEITYSDLNKPAKPFFSKCYRITGKPDYIIKKNNSYIPVEVKTGKHTSLHKNHIFQIAAYCQLLEENYGGFVPYGILVYNSQQQYKIPFDPKMRYELESVIKKMRLTIKNNNITRNHDEPSKCVNCSMRIYCDNKLK
jgi:CRISPR-associated exonuclease Cas4